jgi:hypothetical protein
MICRATTTQRVAHIHKKLSRRPCAGNFATPSKGIGGASAGASHHQNRYATSKHRVKAKGLRKGERQKMKGEGRRPMTES